VAVTTIRKVVSFAVLVMAICALIASWVVFERPYGTVGSIAGGVAPFVALFAALGIVFAGVFARKPSRPANYPRVDHLRIAGKYQAAGRFGETGISPLHLRR
jgi:uncharacterized membrane protein